MSFKIEKAEAITAKMIGWYTGLQKKITDMVPGSITRTKFESLSYEIERLYYRTYVAIKKARATAVYRGFGFTLLSAVKAGGYVTFTADVAPGADIPIAKGTQVATEATSTSEERVYETTADAVLQSGQTTVNVLVSCTVAGEFGNTGAGTIIVMKNTISGIDSVSNAASFDSGQEKETEDGRQARFKVWIASLSRGTDVAIETGAKTAALYDGSGQVTEQVKDSLVKFEVNGVVSCYVFNGTGSTTVELVAEAQKIIDGYKDASNKRIEGYKSAGDVVTVYAATEIAQDVTAAVTVMSGYDAAEILTKVEQIVAAYIDSLGIEEKLILNELIERIMGISGVYNVSVTVPSADVTPNVNEVITPGTITVS